MATESLKRNIVVSGDKEVESFLDAVEASKRDKETTRRKKPPGKLVRDSNELKALMSRRKK